MLNVFISAHAEQKCLPFCAACQKQIDYFWAVRGQNERRGKFYKVRAEKKADFFTSARGGQRNQFILTYLILC
jgi:hypothetical protein